MQVNVSLHFLIPQIILGISHPISFPSYSILIVVFLPLKHINLLKADVQLCVSDLSVLRVSIHVFFLIWCLFVNWFVVIQIGVKYLFL